MAMSAKMRMGIVVVICVIPLSGCNTRIGMPWTYWKDGFWPIIGLLPLGYLALVGVGTGVAVSDGKTYGDRIIMFFLGVAAVAAAGLTLQLFPQTESGIQFLPLPPGRYGGWIPWTISVACWLCLSFACFAILVPVRNIQGIAGTAFFIAFVLNSVVLSFSAPSQSVSSVANETASADSCANTVEHLEKLRADRMEALEQLRSDRDSLIAHIRSLGTHSKRELMANPIGRTLMEELTQLSKQVAALQDETEAMTTVLERAQSMRRCADRQTMLKGHGLLPEKEYMRLSHLDHKIQEELLTITGASAPGSEVQVEKLLNGVFAQ
jgi:hypothetical protein